MDLRTLQAEKLIREHMVVAMGAGLVPIPFADWATTLAVQLNLVRKLAGLYGVPFLSGVAKGLIASLVGATSVRGAVTLIKLLPGVGWVMGGLTASVVAAATTYAVGKVFQKHFEAGGTLQNFDVQAARKVYESAFREGQTLAEADQRPALDPYERLRKLHELHQAGVLSAEEYEKLKQQILSQL
ncbi:MAG: DUF697 domain-containing protein [Bacteroidetes bacterium]|nr:MAG: DUF697 domain-containing protein [Bacteroidota bacterium]